MFPIFRVGDPIVCSPYQGGNNATPSLTMLVHAIIPFETFCYLVRDGFVMSPNQSGCAAKLTPSLPLPLPPPSAYVVGRLGKHTIVVFGFSQGRSRDIFRRTFCGTARQSADLFWGLVVQLGKICLD